MAIMDWHQEIKDAKALLDGHFVLDSGKHSDKYLNKMALFLRSRRTHAMGMGIAKLFHESDIQTVVAPELGAITLGDQSAYWLDMLSKQPVLLVIAEKRRATPNDKEFLFKRDYAEHVRNRRVLIVEDILTTGDSVHRVVNLVRQNGGIVVGVAALCNRGGVTVEALDAPILHQLITLSLDSWPADECLLCRDGVPVNTIFGKGQKFLDDQKAKL